MDTTTEANPLYFVGALLALSSAIFSSMNCIVISKLGNEVATNTQMLWIGYACIAITPLCLLVDENDRIFSEHALEITGAEWGFLVLVSLIGLSGLFVFGLS